MADVLKGGVVRCNDKCGCPFPCPGGLACKSVPGARVNLRVSMITRSALAANIAAATPAHAARLKRPALARPRRPKLHMRRLRRLTYSSMSRADLCGI
ncbi:hypothetical protein OWV82_010935 [Melia azedarach]|uniref:Uncharacterized protein n=1 Tax=Melia azedarach TaxID=155640 RepID=A0ACC1XWF1_MELAZ|nr:hypothetical protein OWV82_010935 [Melia azedarach]